MELVLFEIGQGRFALRASAVSKVLDALPITPLPYAPSDVEGLINVAGSVLLKVDLALRLGLPARSTDPHGNLLVILTGNETVGVQVDRVFNKVTLEDDAVRFHEGGNPQSLIAGEFTLQGDMILLVNERALGLQDMQAEGVPEGGGGLMGAVADVTQAQLDEAVLSDMPTVSVMDGGETYALHMQNVQEIVEIMHLTALPGAGPEVMGLMQLRGQALMVLSLGQLLGRVSDAHPKFVLVIGVEGTRVGLSVADIVGIERYSKEDLQAVSGGDSQLEGYLPGTQERQGRMTGLISLQGLVPEEGMALYRRYLISEGLHMADNLDKGSRTVRRLLAFRLGHERCALDLSLIDRVEEYSAGVDLPEGDTSLTGVIQIKGEIAPILDLRSILGVTPLETTSYVVVRVDGAPWALIVDKIDRVIEIAEKDITPVRTQQSDYLTEVGRLDGELISLLTLDPLASMASVASE
jgi:purine-binding chemotaxis protein CheW